MAANIVPKQTNFVQRYSAAVAQLMSVADSLTLLDAEFASNFYGTGGANAITDAVVQGVIPAASAAQFNSAEAAVAAILGTVNSNRGFLEALRP